MVRVKALAWLAPAAILAWLPLSAGYGQQASAPSAKPAANALVTNAPITNIPTAPVPAVTDDAVLNLSFAGRYDDAAAAAAQRQIQDKDNPAALARDLALVSIMQRKAGHYTAAAKAADQAQALAAKLPKPAAGAAPAGDARFGSGAVQALSVEAVGEVLSVTGHYGPAEAALRQALALTIQAHGAQAPETADVLESLAELLGNADKLSEAGADLNSAMAIRLAAVQAASAHTGNEAAFSAASMLLAHDQALLALLLRASGQLPDAEKMAVAALATDRKVLPPSHPELGFALNALAIVYRAQGKFAIAQALIVEALKIQAAAFKGPNPTVATSANNLALLMEQVGQLTQAEQLLRQVIQIRLAVLGPDHPDLGTTYNNLGGLMRVLGRWNDAEALYKESIRIEVAALGPNHPDVAVGLANLALVLRQEGRFALAEATLRRALEIREAALPPTHPDIAATLTNLGEVFTAEGRAPDAENAFRRALDIQRKSLGAEHPDVAATLNDLAALYREESRYADAETLYTQALKIEQKIYPAGHPEIANTLGNIADLYAAEGRLAEADKLQEAALQMRIKAFGEDHPIVATSLNNLALLRRLQNKPAEAEKLLRRVLAMRIKAFGDNHPDVAGAYNNLAEVLVAEHRLSPALDAMRKATAIYQERAEEGEEANSAAADAERKAARYAFINHVNLLSEAIKKTHGKRQQDLVAESFAVSQLAQNWSVGAVVAQMAARFAAGSGDLAKLVRDEQDTQEQWRKLDAILIKAALQPQGSQNAQQIVAWRQQRSALAQHVRDLDGTIQQRFPDYAEAVSLKPVTLPGVQKLLRPHEAILSYLLADQGTFIWVVTRDHAALIKRPVSQTAIANAVRALRKGLDPSQLLDGRLPIYDVGLANKLYQQIVAPAKPDLGGVQRIMVMSDGPLQSLPLAVLVASKPHLKPGQVPDYRKTDWLARRYAFSVLPSIGSLRALRLFSHGVEAPQPFLGIGDPLLGGPRLRSRAVTSDGVDVRLVRELAPLPETANELRAMATTLDAPGKDIYTSGFATRKAVLNLPVANFRVVAFATHGLLTGELKGLTEPALVLTPDIGTPGDNGLLLASQIAQMHFDADWVVLSACDTAGSDGTPGAEGLSGLAKAFFYAGARALLVSHWPVNSQASVQLTTTAIGLMAKNPKIGKAQALEESEMRLMQSSTFFSHPMMWAPFIVVGEGGANVS